MDLLKFVLILEKAWKKNENIPKFRVNTVPFVKKSACFFFFFFFFFFLTCVTSGMLHR